MSVKVHRRQRFMLYEGQVLDGLAQLPDDSVHCVVTSPPYWGLRDYQQDGQIGLEATFAEFQQKMVDIFREVRRVLRPDGTCFVNLGDTFVQGATGKSNNKKSLDGSGGNTAYKQSRSWSTAMPGLKRKDMLCMPFRIAMALQADGWWLRQAIVWCLSGGASVYARTSTGDRPLMIKDMVKMKPENVKLWNGQKWTQVLGFSASTDTGRTLEIELRSGERIGCTAGHQWPTKRGLVRADKLIVGDVIETTTLPEPDSPATPSALNGDVAWFCGLYLAEGSLSGNTVQIAGNVSETEYRMKRLRKVAEAFHGSLHAHNTTGNSATINLEGPMIASVVKTYVHGNDAKTKGIKYRAWQRSNLWLKEFFNGYLDGDGHLEPSTNRWRITFCRNDRLADDFRTLAARLGMNLRLSATTTKAFGKTWPVYRGDVRMSPTKHFNARESGEVTHIRSSNARQFWDIGVEDEPHLFALSSGVLTHNSKANPLPEAVKDRCINSHEYVFLLAKSERYFFDVEAITEPVSGTAHHRGHGVNKKAGRNSRFHLLQDAQHSGRNRPRERQNESFSGAVKDLVERRRKRSVWSVALEPSKEEHTAAFPRKLIRPAIRAGASIHGCCSMCGAPYVREVLSVRKATRPGRKTKVTGDSLVDGNRDTKRHVTAVETLGWIPSCECVGHVVVPCTVLDIFMGTGTTAVEARFQGMNAIGIELSPKYVRISLRRNSDVALF